MPRRAPVARSFYPGDTRRQAEEFLRDFRPPAGLPARPVAGVVPHAGWAYSGRIAARVFAALKARRSPAVFILFGAVHRGVAGPAVFPEGVWEFPGGAVEVDAAAARALLAALPGLAAADPGAHAGEHSLEVQAPLIAALFPRAKIVPVAVPPAAAAPEIGRRVGLAVGEQGLDAVVVGTTDLTHYGEPYGFLPAGTGPEAKKWMTANDRRVIERALALDAAGILAEAEENHNACGAGALAATAAAAKALGAARGLLMDYATSADVRPEPGEFAMAVGYAGIVY